MSENQMDYIQDFVDVSETSKEVEDWDKVVPGCLRWKLRDPCIFASSHAAHARQRDTAPERRESCWNFHASCRSHHGELSQDLAWI